jgi:tetratricopeptide (TPR) repeat protein
MLGAAGLMSGAVLAAGCCSLSWRPDADKVVAARELVGRGIEAQQDGRDEEAARLYTQAMELCPVDERCRRQYAEVLWRQGQGQEAIGHMREAVRLSGGDPLLLVHLGEMHLALGDDANALRQAEAAIARRENLAPAWALRGEVYHRRGDVREALACYHRALRYEPLNPPVQIAMAGIHRELGRPERSLAVLDAAVDQCAPAPAPPELLAHHGLALKALGRFEEAVESLTAAAQHGHDPEIAFQLAEARYLAGDAAGASLAVRQLLQTNPYHEGARQLEVALREQQPVAVMAPR